MMRPSDQKSAHLKTQVQHLIPYIGIDDIDILLKLITKTDIEIAKPPETGLLMMSVKDCFDIDFHLGEVLVTTAEVKLKENRAYAMVMGDFPKAAVLLASLELLPVLGTPEIVEQVQSVIDTLLSVAERKKQQEEHLTAATRMDFESMKKEAVDFGSLT